MDVYLRVEDPRERSLLGDASLVAHSLSDGGRGERGDLRHQLARPLALAQQEDPRVESLDVVGAEDSLRVAPDDKIDAGGVVVVKGEGEVHVGEDGVVVHPQHPLDALKEAAASGRASEGSCARVLIDRASVRSSREMVKGWPSHAG